MNTPLKEDSLPNRGHNLKYIGTLPETGIDSIEFKQAKRTAFPINGKDFWNRVGNTEALVYIADDPDTEYFTSPDLGVSWARSPIDKKYHVFHGVVLNESLTWSGHKLSYRTKFQGMNISIENRKGSIRRGTATDGTKWETKMTWPYGYLLKTVGKDGDHVDCFLGPNRDSSRVFVVHQLNDDGEFDEDKIMLGWDTEQEAKEAYLSNYDTDIYFGSIEMLTLDEFKDIAFKHKGKKITLEKETKDLKETLDSNIDDVQVIRDSWGETGEASGSMRGIIIQVRGYYYKIYLKCIYEEDSKYRLAISFEIMREGHEEESIQNLGDPALVGKIFTFIGKTAMNTISRYPQDLVGIYFSGKTGESSRTKLYQTLANIILKRYFNGDGKVVVTNELGDNDEDSYSNFEIILNKPLEYKGHLKEAFIPQKVETAYKLFRVNKKFPGKLFPLFVDSNKPVPFDIWVDADLIPPDPTNNGKIKSKLGPLAYRPGWHSGAIPVATHIGLKGEGNRDEAKPTHRNPDYVWAEIQVPSDVDWQSIANSRAEKTKAGGINHKTAHITDQLPKGGYYRYRTNPNMTGEWLISGEMKVIRVLSDEEVNAVNTSHGFADLPRKEPLDLGSWGFGPDGKPLSSLQENSQPLMAPNGKPSNLKPYLYHIVRSDSFKRWFGDWENNPKQASKCVDSNGEPLVVYHGTGTSFSKFEIPGEEIESKTSHSTSAIYFTPDPKLAGEFAGGFPHEKQLKPCFLNIRNSYHLPYNEMDWYEVQEIFDTDINDLQKKGYDGGSANISEGEFTDSPQWFIFDPKNAKAIYNKGGFSTKSSELSEAYPYRGKKTWGPKVVTWTKRDEEPETDYERNYNALKKPITSPIEDKPKEELEESKNYGDLYHFTSVVNAQEILKNHEFRLALGTYSVDSSEKRYYLSLTRNKNGWKDISYLGDNRTNEVGFVFDGSSLTQKYKINPYLDVDNNIGRHDQEREERLFSSTGPIPDPRGGHNVLHTTYDKKLPDFIKKVVIYAKYRGQGFSIGNKAMDEEQVKMYFEHWITNSGYKRPIPVEIQYTEKQAPKQSNKKKSWFMKESFNINAVQDKDKFYSIFKNSYEKATGQAWDRPTFDRKSRYWTFYGDETGAIAVTKKRDPFSSYKIVALFGEMKGINLGLKEFFASKSRIPIYTLSDDRLGAYMENHYNMIRVPDPVVASFGKELFGSLGYGPVNDPEKIGTPLDIGGFEAVKYVLGNKAFYKALLEHLPEDIANSPIITRYKNYI